MERKVQKSSFLSQIDKFYSGKMASNEVIQVGKTPRYLEALGVKELPVLLKQKTLNKCIREAKGSKSAHNLSRELIEQMPNHLERPVFAVNEMERNSYALISDTVDQNGKPMLLAVKLSSSIHGMEVHEISSYYGRSNINDYLLKKNEVFICDMKRAKNLSRILRLQLPTAWKVLDYNNNVSRMDSKVNKNFTELDDRTLFEDLINALESEKIKEMKTRMGKVLVIAEKPSVGNDIAKVLHCTEKHQGYIEGANYIVTWALGHLVGLKYPEEHEERFKNWNLEDLPLVFPVSNSLKVLPDTRAQFKVIKDLIHRDDVDSLINAGDAGREGYLIQSWIYRMCGNQKPVKVLWASSMTQEAIEEAMSNLKDDSDFQGLLEEAETRALGDYLLGINYSRLLTLTRAQGTILSYGRCQTPLLNMIVQRDKEIENFKQTPFYNIQIAYRKGFSGILISEEKERRDLLDHSYAEELLQGIQGKNAIVNEYTTEDKSKKAPLLYNLAELQKVMGARYKYTPDYTLELCQSLYEKHKLLSYPRTDSRYLSKDLFNVIGKHLECYRFGVFKGLLENMDISKIECESRYFNDHKVTDHHAMIPVINESAEEIYKNLTRDERNVFDAVVLSLIAIFYPEYRYTKTEIITSIGDLKFYSQGKTVLTLGYKVVLNDVEEKDQEEDKQEILPALQPGDKLTVDNLEIKDKLTQPPRPYSISTLINAMEKYGIGTSATRAEIINKLQNPKRPYVKYEKSIYRSTMLGRQLIEVVPDELKNPELTRQFEESLLQVNEGKKSSDDVLREMTSELKANITLFSNQSPAVKITNDKTSYGVCPKCKKGQIYANIKGYGCSEYKQGCSFFISKTIAGKQISESMVHKLLQTGKTDIMKGFTGNKGKFSARLIIKGDKTIGFSFK